MGSETHIVYLFSGLGTDQAQCGETTPLRLVVLAEGMVELARARQCGGTGAKQGPQAQQPVSTLQPRGRELLPKQHFLWNLTDFPSEIR